MAISLAVLAAFMAAGAWAGNPGRTRTLGYIGTWAIVMPMAVLLGTGAAFTSLEEELSPDKASGWSLAYGIATGVLTGGFWTAVVTVGHRRFDAGRIGSYFRRLALACLAMTILSALLLQPVLWFRPDEYLWTLTNELLKRLLPLPLIVLGIEGMFYLAYRRRQGSQGATTGKEDGQPDAPERE